MTKHALGSRIERCPVLPEWPRAALLRLIVCLVPLGCSSPETNIVASPQPTPDLLECHLSPTPPPEISPTPIPCLSELCQSTVRLNELMSSNDGAWIDEPGQTDDWIEVYNPQLDPVNLRGMQIADSQNEPYQLADLVVPAEGTLLLWADNETLQGDAHVPFKLSAGGDSVVLLSQTGAAVDEIELPGMLANESYQRWPDGEGAFVLCGFATPDRSNGESCGPPAPSSQSDDVQFCPFTWPDPFPTPSDAVVINEVYLGDAASSSNAKGGITSNTASGPFIELGLVGDSPVALADYQLRVATLIPGQTWPSAAEGIALELPSGNLEPGAYPGVAIPAEAMAVLEGQDVQAVLTLFDTATGTALDRFEIMSWPWGKALARFPDLTGINHFCGEATPNATNASCLEITSRSIGTYLRSLQTPGDFESFGAADSYTGTDSVKVLVDLHAGNQVYFLDSAAWDLHYTFVREVIEGQEHLDRCDPEEASVFNAGWSAFSQENYYQTDNRHYLLGTLVHFGSNDLYTLEINTADAMLPDQLSVLFWTSMLHLWEPPLWVIRAADENQIAKVQALNGTVPAVGPSAAFEDLTYQPLNEGINYRVLEYLPSSELEQAVLGSQVIVVTDAVPLDIDLVAGLITETFQTPLSHVAVLSKNRGTPNMALVDAHIDPKIAPFLGELVRLEVASGDFTIDAATAEEANEFWASQQQEQEPLAPNLDSSLRGLQVLADHDLASLPAIGAKAAQLAELQLLAASLDADDVPIYTPANAFALPMAHYLEHFEASGAASLLALLEANPDFQADPNVRDEGLKQVRELILDWQVEAELLDEVEAYIAEYFGSIQVRLRSSSNTEDIPGFSGAGLYTSVSADLTDPNQTVEAGIRTVWASLWNSRAYE